MGEGAEAHVPRRSVHARAPLARQGAALKRSRARLAGWCVAALLAAPALAVEGIEFDVAAFEKKPFEWSGYLEARPESQRLDRGSALYGLQFAGQSRERLARTALAAEISGVVRRGEARLHFTGHASWLDDPRGDASDYRFYEAYGAWQPATGATLEAGKRTLRWGKGYAFSPVAFFERARDPTDPELSREGFALATGSVVRSFPGPLATVSLTPVVLPTRHGLNEAYGPGEHWNAGARLYALYADTDIDILYAGAGGRGARVGADFSRNLRDDLEIHGEWARLRDVPRTTISEGGALVTRAQSHGSGLVGLRYLSAAQTTVILEYYRNGAGYTREEARRFFELARRSASEPALRALAARAAAAGFAGPNPMRDYVYLRVSQPEPFDILYFTPAITAIVNARDGSFTVMPEVVYTRVANLEARLRVQVNRGARLTDFGEKPADWRIELRLRYFL